MQDCQYRLTQTEEEDIKVSKEVNNQETKYRIITKSSPIARPSHMSRPNPGVPRIGERRDRL